MRYIPVLTACMTQQEIGEAVLRADCLTAQRFGIRAGLNALNNEREPAPAGFSVVDEGAGPAPAVGPTLTFTDPSRADLAIDALADAGLTEEADQLRRAAAKKKNPAG